MLPLPAGEALRRCGARATTAAAFAVLLMISVPSVTLGGHQAVTTSGAWLQVNPALPVPSARRGAGVVYDSRRDQLIVVGGYGGDNGTWFLRMNGLPQWTRRDIAMPAPDENDRAVYDAASDRVVLIKSNMDVWALDLGNPVAWAPINVSGKPRERIHYSVAYDGQRHRLLVFGGIGGADYLNDAWALSLDAPNAWVNIAAPGGAPAGRYGAFAVVDPVRDRLVVGMGQTSSALQNDVWILPMAGSQAWSQLLPSGLPPLTRVLGSAVYDPVGDGIILFGGAGAESDLTALRLSGTPAWSQLTSTGSPPTGRWWNGAVWRTGSGEMWIYGGWNAGVAPFGDTWLLQMYPAGPPRVVGFYPSGGVVGDQVTITGLGFQDVSDVQFNGTSAPIGTAGPDAIVTSVPAGATSGPIQVVTPQGASSSTASFFVGERPVIVAVYPDSGVVGDQVEIHGQHFAGATTVSFGGSGAAAFEVVADTLIRATVDSLASPGPVSVTTPAATGSGAGVFRLLPTNPSPTLMYVRDIRADQGGKVVLYWRASHFDRSPNRVITGYRVWRRAPALAVGAIGPQALEARGNLGGVGVQAAEYWESLADLPAASLPGYAYTATTARDSLGGSNPFTAFFVQSLTADPFVFYSSNVDSGYSVDNLSPPAPGPFAVVYSSAQNTLHWSARPTPDLKEYRLYRGATQGFVPDAASLVNTSRDTQYVDLPGSFHYKLVAVDVHGNLSRILAASPESPVATLVTLLSAERTAEGVRLRWYANGNDGLFARVQRRIEGGNWIEIGTTSVDGRGYLTFDDLGVEPGRGYGYRLSIPGDEEEAVYAGEVWIAATLPPLALIGVSPNPAPGGKATLVLSLAANQDALVEVFDIHGRRVESHLIREPRGGGSNLELGRERRLRPGVYLVRLAQGGRVVHARAVAVD